MATDNSTTSSELVPDLEPLRFRDLPIFNLPTLDTMLKHTAESLTVKPSGVIFNTVQFLEPSSLEKLRLLYGTNKVFPIGPLHSTIAAAADNNSTTSILTEDFSCIAWLNEQPKRSVLYVSLGSIVSWNENELTEVAWGLANSEQRFLWVIRDDVSNWLESLPERVKTVTRERGRIVKWAPQRHVLSHVAVGGFWSHCGWNSTLEGLCEGVAVMCQPCFGDQRVNARLLSYVWRVGMEWGDVVGRWEVERAVRKVMVGGEGVGMRERAAELRDKIGFAVREGGSSYQALNGLVDSILSANQSHK